MKKSLSLLTLMLLAGSSFGQDLAEGVYYVKSASSDVYLTRGQSWGTQAVVAPYGHPWKVTLSEGKYKLQMYDIFTAGETAKALGDNGYVDNGKPMALTIAPGATEGSHTIANNETFIYPNEANAIAFGSTAYDWKFISADEYKADIEASTASQEAAVAAQAGIDLEGGTLTTYLANNYVGKTLTTGFTPVPTEGNSDWTYNMESQRHKGLGYGSYGIECFQGTGNLVQNLTNMSKGIYKVGIKAMQRSVANTACYTVGSEGFVNSGCYLIANDKVVNIKDWYSSCTSNTTPDNPTEELARTEEGGYYSEVYTYVGEDGKLDLTVNFPSYWTASWFVFNGIDIVYYMDKNSGTAALVAEFDGLVAQADSLLALPMAEDVKLALEAAKVAPTEDSVEAYNDALSTLKAALKAALTSTKKYDNVAGHDVTTLTSNEWVGATGVFGKLGCTERYNAGTYVGDVMTQTISGLIPGAVYEVVIEATASYTSGRGFVGQSGDNLTVIFANNDSLFIPVVERVDVDALVPYTISGTVNKEGNLTFGIRNVITGANWFVIKMGSLTTKGNPTEEAFQHAQTAIASVKEALNEADAAIVNPSYTNIVATYRATLEEYIKTTDTVCDSINYFYAEVALLDQVDRLLAKLPTVESIKQLVKDFEDAIAYNQHLAVKKAKLLHTASVCWSSNNTKYNDVDAEKEHYNTNTASGWSGCAFAEFDFKGLNAKSIATATLTWTTVTGGRANSNRANEIYYLTPGTELGYDTIPTGACGAEYLFTDSRTKLETYTGMNTFTAQIDVAPAIEAALAAGKNNVIFQWTGNIAAADLMGKGSELAPTLEIQFDMAPTLKKTFIQDFETADVAGWTANSAANCYIGEADGNHFAAAVQNGSGNRGAYYDGSTEAIKTALVGETSWAIEWDLALQSGNINNRSQALFGLGTSASEYPINSPAVTNLLFCIEGDQTTAGMSDVWYITSAPTSETVVPEDIKLATVNLDPKKFYHYQLTYNNGTVTAKITDEDAGTLVGTATYPTTYTLDDLRGFVTCVGRGSGYTYLDNIAIGKYTYDEIVEDPVFTPQGESYDTVYVAITTETADAVIKYTIDGGETLTYTAPVELASTATLAAWAEKNGSVSNTISKRFVACVTPAPSISKTGLSYGADTVTITSDVPGATLHYSINEGEVLDYTKPFITDNTITVTAFAVYENRQSENATLNVVAGEVATPEVSLVKVIDAERYIALSTATAAANLVYVLNDEAEVVGELGKDTIVLTADTKIKVWARYTEGEKVFESEAIDTTFAAGTLIQLAGVEISTEDYSAVSKSADLKVATSQLEVLLNPAVEIVWAYGETNGVAANGDIIKGVPVGAKFTAYTRAAGYIDSEVSTVEVVPSYASTIFSEDYEDGTTGSWTAHDSWPMTNTEAADGTHFLHFYQEGQGGNRWAQLEFPEYSSTAYTLSFKIGIAAGNDAPSTFTVYAGQDTLFQFNTPTDIDRTAGERITTVLNKNGETIGTFGFYLKERFVWADDKLANVEVTVSESGVVLTVVNNLGLTQVKTKIADAPVVITKLYEDFGRRYGSFRIDDVKIAGRAGSVMAPEFALHHYDVCDPAIAITDATDKTKIFYRAASTTYTIDEDGNIVPGEYTFTGEFIEYNNPVAFTYDATIIEAYAVYEGVVESAKSISPVYLHLSSIEAPTVTFAAVVDTLTRSFSVKDNTSELVSATLYYQAIGASEANVLEESTIQPDSAAYGWFSVYAQVGDLKSATAYRYVDSRTVYNEPYIGFCGAGNSFPAEIADFEATVGATIVGDYPTSPVPTTGTQRIHVATKGENYAAVVLPFSFTTGTNVVTNAKGDTLEYGVDYQFVTIHTRTAQNADNNADLTLLTTFRNVESAVRTKGVAFQAGKSVLVKALTENVGNEIVLHSLPTAPIAVGTAITKVPTNGGWRIVSNNRYQDLALETPAYVLNDEGTKFVYTENPIVGSLSVAILVDPASVDALGKQILLVDDGSSVIETIAAEGQNTGNIYDLQGRKVQQVVNGQMYIVNGKRLIMK